MAILEEIQKKRHKKTRGTKEKNKENARLKIKVTCKTGRKE